jgi:hypothetical protein
MFDGKGSLRVSEHIDKAGSLPYEARYLDNQAVDKHRTLLYKSDMFLNI